VPGFPLLRMTQSEGADAHRGTKKKGETLVTCRCPLRLGIVQSALTGCALVELQKPNEKAVVLRPRGLPYR